MKPRTVLTIGAVFLAAITAVFVVYLSRQDQQSKAAEQKYGVKQVNGQTWEPFYAAELTKAQAAMKSLSVAKLAPGQEYATIIRAIKVARHGANYGCLSGWNQCGAALLVFQSEAAITPPAWHLVHARADHADLFATCYVQGDQIVLNWGAMQAQFGVTNPQRISNESWIRPVNGTRRCPVTTTPDPTATRT